MRLVLLMFFCVVFNACTLDKKEKFIDGVEEQKKLDRNIEWSLVEEDNFQFKVPTSWKSVSYADTIPKYFAFKLFEGNDSAFFQISIDSSDSKINSYLKDEFEMMDSWDAVNTEKYCIEQIQLKNNKSVWYAQLDFDVSGINKAGHFFIVPYKGRLYQLRLAMPSNWDSEWARYLMSQLAFKIKVEGVNVFMKKDEIKEVHKDCN